MNINKWIHLHYSFSSSSLPIAESFSRSGDHGQSKTLAGDSLPKDNKIFNAIGAAEELLSFIGLVMIKNK